PPARLQRLERGGERAQPRVDRREQCVRGILPAGEVRGTRLLAAADEPPILLPLEQAEDLLRLSQPSRFDQELRQIAVCRLAIGIADERAAERDVERSQRRAL